MFPRIEDKSAKFLATAESLSPMAKIQTKQLVVCIDNKGYAPSLEKWKIYVALRDAAAEKHGLLRIVDESGEDYLHPKKSFRPIALPLAGNEPCSPLRNLDTGCRIMARPIRKADVKQVPWNDQVENDPHFLRRIEQARARQIRAKPGSQQFCGFFELGASASNSASTMGLASSRAFSFSNGTIAALVSRIKGIEAFTTCPWPQGDQLRHSRLQRRYRIRDSE